MVFIRAAMLVIARFFLSLVFLAGAVNKILHWHESERFLLQTLCEWQTYVGFSDSMHHCFGITISLMPLLLIIGTVFELVGALLVLLGIKEKLGTTLLILFLIPTTILMHQFWFVDENVRELQLAHFLKNLAILGGLMLILLKNSEKPKTPFSKF